MASFHLPTFGFQFPSLQGLLQPLVGLGELLQTRPLQWIKTSPLSPSMSHKAESKEAQRRETMGQGGEEKTRPEPKVDIQERGEIFFFYRPKVNREEARSPDDVQRMYVVLRPESGERSVEEKQSPDSGKEGKMSRRDGENKNGSEGEEGKTSSEGDEDKKGNGSRDGKEGGRGCEEVNIEERPLLRFIVMGKKSLPDPKQRSRPFWGFVELVTTKIEDIKAALQGEEYETATRGHRHKPPARALAEGIYRILRHQSGRQTHTHLVYKLEFPPGDTENEPQESLNIEREASYLIQIKNPEQGGGSGGFGGLQSKRKASFPAHLQGQFGKRRFHAADPPDFLNYEGCELLLIAAADDVEEELGLELKTECEADAKCSDLLQVFGEAASSKPLLSGTWL
ncbi:hypothetical protein Cni_G05055 [Canna indica]|uniref:Uncharacterized protein n=1 Tax=Canna indica TaxID=4628 RepID=A0AAQ3JTU8_9LILI|nr:hypothetical protein Cni_G05055 [Canna indica]